MDHYIVIFQINYCRQTYFYIETNSLMNGTEMTFRIDIDSKLWRIVTDKKPWNVTV